LEFGFLDAAPYQAGCLKIEREEILAGYQKIRIEGDRLLKTLSYFAR